MCGDVPREASVECLAKPHTDHVRLRQVYAEYLGAWKYVGAGRESTALYVRLINSLYV